MQKKDNQWIESEENKCGSHSTHLGKNSVSRLSRVLLFPLCEFEQITLLSFIENEMLADIFLKSLCVDICIYL